LINSWQFSPQWKRVPRSLDGRALWATIHCCACSLHRKPIVHARTKHHTLSNESVPDESQ
jgi:hypothetical protein